MAGAICDSLNVETSEDPLESDEDDEDNEVGSSPERDNAGQRHWWHVNKTGFPIEEETWERMWEHVIQVHPQGIQVARSIRGQLIEKVELLETAVTNYFIKICRYPFQVYPH